MRIVLPARESQELAHIAYFGALGEKLEWRINDASDFYDRKGRMAMINGAVPAQGGHTMFMISIVFDIGQESKTGFAKIEWDEEQSRQTANLTLNCRWEQTRQ